MVVATDSTWRWKFVAGNRGEDTHGYTRLWASAIRWLIRDPAMSPIQVDVVGDMHELAAPGEPVSQATARVVVVRPDYLAAADQPVDVVARRRAPGGAVGEGEILMALDQARTDDKGHLEVSIPLTHHGVIEVSVSTRVSGGRSVEASDLFVVTGAATETERTLPDPEWLAALAQKTGGSVQTFSTADPSFPTSPPQARATLSRHHDEVWTSPWVLLLVVSLASTEWALRRRWGLL